MNNENQKINQELFLLEKYKYILSRKNSLNDKTFKIIAFYQVVVFSLFVSFYSVFTSFKKGAYDYDLALMFSNCIFFFFVVLSLYVTFMLISGVKSWLKYRGDEDEINNVVFGKSRDKIKFINFLFWYETYIIISVILVCLSVVLFYIYRYEFIFGVNN